MRVTIGAEVLVARLEEGFAPATCASLRGLLPLSGTLLHARWSGECGWSPLGPVGFKLPSENATSAPAPGQILLYAGELSEPEILVPYGAAAFACREGPLAGNHVMTITDGAQTLPAIGHALLWRGALPIVFELD